MIASFRILLPALFMAGFSAVAGEVAWTRALRRILGSTTGATAIVLAGFMGGLALGSWLGERALETAGPRRARWALGMWAVLSAVSGGASLLFTTILTAAGRADSLPGSLEVPILLLLVLTAAPLGAGLPFAVAALGEGPSARKIGILYGINALGGAAGALAMPLLLIPALGESLSLAASAILQAAAGGVVGASLKAIPPAADAPRNSPPGTAHPPPGSGGSRERAPILQGILLVFLSGLAVIYWEILWTRILTLVVGASVVAFSVVAGSVILGIGLGSVFAGDRGARGSRIVPMLVLGILGIAYFLVPRLPEAYIIGIRAFGGSALSLDVGLPGLAVLLACAPLGLIFPWALARAPERTGTLQAANGVGSALGALLGGPVLAGRVGIEGAYILGVALVGGLLLPGGIRGRGKGRGRRILLALGLLLLPLCLALLQGSGLGWDMSRLVAGVYQWPVEEILGRGPGAREPGGALLIAEGREAIVSIEERGNTVFVKANGKVEGTVPLDPKEPSLADLPTQILLGALPGLFSMDGPVGVIGLGSGTTLGAAFRSVRGPIDLLEIEPEFRNAIADPRVARRFEPYLGGALESSRVGWWYGDARVLLAGPLSGKSWIALVSQPSEPWLPSSEFLFTQEFFGRAARRIEREGAFFQWVQLYKISPSSLELLLRTFRSAFERVFVMRPPGTGELILLGSRRPLDLEILLTGARRLETESPGFLRAMGMEVPEDLLAAVLLGPDGIDGWVGGSPGLPLNSDDRGDLVLPAARLLHSGKELAASNLRMIRERGGSDPISRYLKPAFGTPGFLRRLAARNIYLGDFWEAKAILSGDGSEEAESLRREADREIAILDRAPADPQASHQGDGPGESPRAPEKGGRK